MYFCLRRGIFALACWCRDELRCTDRHQVTWLGGDLFHSTYPSKLLLIGLALAEFPNDPAYQRNEVGEVRGQGLGALGPETVAAQPQLVQGGEAGKVGGQGMACLGPDSHV